MDEPKNTITITGDLNADMRTLLSFYLNPSDADYYIDAMNIEPIPVEQIEQMFNDSQNAVL